MCTCRSRHFSKVNLDLDWVCLKPLLTTFNLDLAKTLQRCWSYWKSFIFVNFFKFFCCLSVCKMTTTEFPSFSSGHNYPWQYNTPYFLLIQIKLLATLTYTVQWLQPNAYLYIWHCHWVWSSDSLWGTMWLIKHKYLNPHLPQHPDCNKMKLLQAL